MQIRFACKGEEGLGQRLRAVELWSYPLGVDDIDRVLRQLLGGYEEKQAVLDDVATKRATILVPVVSAFRGVRQFFGMSLPVECFVTVELKSASVPIVCARFGNHVDDAVCCAALFGSEPVGDYLEFLDGLKTDGLQQAPVQVLIIVCVIDIEACIAAAASGDRGHQPICFGRVSVKDERNAWGQHGKVCELARLQRQISHL